MPRRSQTRRRTRRRCGPPAPLVSPYHSGTGPLALGQVGLYPDTARWEQPVPGESTAAQLRTVQAWHDAAGRDAKQRMAVAFGIRVPSAIEQALGIHRGATDWDLQVARSLDCFTDCPWKLTHPCPSAAGDPA